MRKRVLAGLLTLSLVLGITACGKGASPLPGSDDAASEAGAKTEQNVAAGENSDAADDQVIDRSERPEILKYTDYISEATEIEGLDNPVYLTGGDEWLSLSDESKSAYPALGKKLDELMSSRRDQTKSDVSEMVTDMRDLMENSSEEDRGYMAEMSYYYDHGYYVRRVDELVTSVLSYQSSFNGGVHGYTGYGCINLDSDTGEEISLPDVIADRNALESELKERLLATYDQEMFFDLDDSIKSICDETYGQGEGVGYSFTWVFDPDGITFVFSPYDIAAYAAGAQTVTIPYGSGLINDKYLLRGGNGYVIGLPEYIDKWVDLSGNGDMSRLSVYRYDYDYESDYVISEMIAIDDVQYEVKDMWAYELTPYLVMTGDGRTYIYLDTVSDNGYRTLYMVEAEKDGSEVTVSSIGEGNYIPSYSISDSDFYPCYVPADPTHLHYDTRFDILSTYEAGKIYSISDGGIPNSEDDLYVVHNNITLTSVEDLTCDVVDEAGNVVESGVTILAGSKYIFYRTDGDSFVDAMIDDGRIVRLNVTREDYRDIVNGSYAEDVFDMLYYAG